MPSSDVTAAGAVRYRCDACGNRTRFDVTVRRTTRSFHHYSLGGALTVESVDVLDDDTIDVSCRWCGNGRAVLPVIADATAPAGGVLPGGPVDTDAQA